MCMYSLVERIIGQFRLAGTWGATLLRLLRTLPSWDMKPHPGGEIT